MGFQDLRKFFEGGVRGVGGLEHGRFLEIT